MAPNQWRKSSGQNGLSYPDSKKEQETQLLLLFFNVNQLGVCPDTKSVRPGK